jgi:hypothetical protein
MTEKEELLGKLLLVWQANSSYSLVGLLGKLRDEQYVFVKHKYRDGVTADIDAATRNADLSGWTDEGLKAALNALL